MSLCAHYTETGPRHESGPQLRAELVPVLRSEPRAHEIADGLAAVDEGLDELAASPLSRALRGQAALYGRIVQNWSVFPPTEQQRIAMLDRVTDLLSRVWLAT